MAEKIYGLEITRNKSTKLAGSFIAMCDIFLPKIMVPTNIQLNLFKYCDQGCCQHDQSNNHN